MPSFLPLTIVSVTAATYPGPAQVIAGFTPNSWSFANESISTDIYFSFDGTNDHGILQPGKPNETTVWNSATMPTSVWFRRSKVSTTAERVIVQASGA